ncbi:hypothetical protein CDD81_1747 [Ophiocordyceps australis]|uniref:Uncharacterized protein n=1 Tax=Ophiocordyceps australis TaxID=1399860 RepID=A0A2C5YFL5_9HYPO|nr:hypothetical protein CDD81_1747 [Ophiocordyceps australis]
MMPMQRSLSSPVRPRSSPPVSPTLTHAPPDAPEPALWSKDHEPDVTSSRPRRPLSPCPRASDASQTLPLRRADEPQRRGRHRHASPPYQKPIVAQPLPSCSSPTSARHELIHHPVTPLPDDMASSAPPPKPLLDDVSLYTNPHLTRDSHSTTLEELAHVVRLSKYQERKRANTRVRLQRSLVSTALSARLTRCGEIAYRNLVDNFRKDDKDSFAALYNAIHDVRKSCDELRRFALLEPDLDSLSSPALTSSDSLDTPTSSVIGAATPKSAAPFLHDLSAASRDAFVDFICQIRTDPNFLAARICALDGHELNALLSYHKGLEPVESVLPYHGRSGIRSHTSTPGRSTHSVEIERLLSFQRHDPLSILIHTCFANSAGPDSSEDQLRTDIWSTVLAKLIQKFNSYGEHFLVSVFNIWTTMRDWSGKSNMEWYLMRILEDGAFLLDRAEDQHGTRFNISNWNHSDEVAAKEFYEKAVDGLFELVDDEDATGIPEGLLELGNAVISKLRGQYVENTSKWLVWRFLFFNFLLGVVVHPESHGLLTDYHITPYAREKILKKVVMKAHEYVSSMWSGKPSATCVPVQVPAKIETHVESILARFQGSRSRLPAAAKLLPARSITSLRETAEVHPYLVVSPADLVTLVNALFPEPRPLSAGSNMRSGSASISGLSAISQSIPISNSRANVETASIISTSICSGFSDGTTSRETLSDDANTATPQRYSPPCLDAEAQRCSTKYEDDGYRLKLAVHELSQKFGSDGLSGTGHPCAEKWAVLFISANSRSLSTHMTYDPEDEHDEEESSSSVDTDDEDEAHGPELGKDYHQLRDSILRLVVDYEIPRNLEPQGERAQLSNRALRLKRYRSKNKVITPEKTMSSMNPYRAKAAKEAGGSSDAVQDGEPVLITMLKAASAQSKAQGAFISSHVYWNALKHLRALESPTLRDNGFAALINIFARGPRDSIRRSASAIEEYDAWLVWLKQSQERHEGLIDRMMRRVRAMRDKMWYVTDVRNSKEYVHSRDICQALKNMGMPRRWDSFQRSRATATRAPMASYLYRTESQIMDLLAASEDQGGPNKLSDDQAEKTSRWLQQYGIPNFCQGEERIHRFCCEVDSCISKLIGETLRDAPVLWSSELYKRDKLVYDRMRAREKELFADDGSSVLSDSDRRFTPCSSRPSSYARDARSNSSHSANNHSMDSARFSCARSSAPPLSDISDSHDGFEKATSPLHAHDAASTYWSPFRPSVSPRSSVSRAYSPTTSLTNLSTTFSGSAFPTQPSISSASMGRPGTSASSNETVFAHRAEDEKTRFLNDLRQSLTSLLLSDLGNLVLGRGSETDLWFQKLGQQCIDRKEAVDRRARKRPEKRDKEKHGRSSTRSRVIEKKKSCSNLRGAGDDRKSDTSECPPASEHEASAKIAASAPRDGGADFPFKKAFQRLLNMFCVHPNPYAKLNALNELEHLIMAWMLSNGTKKMRASWSDAGSSVIEEQAISRQKQLEETIDNVKERRSQALQTALPLPASFVAHSSRKQSAETRSIMSGTATSTDAVTRELQNLFRDASLRPKSLFRDLQLIAAFVQPSVLDNFEKGKAFWNTGLAALKVKLEVCRTMMEMADEVIAAHTRARKAPGESLGPAELTPSATGTPPPAAMAYNLKDAGKMWVITAKEGSPTAQRELALFYLSNPESVERTTLPLSKPREVFKQTVMERYGRSERARGAMGPVAAATKLGVASANVVRGPPGATGTASADGQALPAAEGDVRNDAGLMCLAVHWMEAAEQGGDELATSFLRQNEFVALA